MSGYDVVTGREISCVIILQRHFVIMAAETGVLDAPNAVSEAPKDHVAL
ncbi:MAG: hypothetical protein ACE5EX_04960 [Phycisphaerae bacterium]